VVNITAKTIINLSALYHTKLSNEIKHLYYNKFITCEFVNKELNGHDKIKFDVRFLTSLANKNNL